MYFTFKKSSVFISLECSNFLVSQSIDLKFYSVVINSANSAHDPVCEQLMDAHNIYANSALGICK